MWFTRGPQEERPKPNMQFLPLLQLEPQSDSHFVTNMLHISGVWIQPPLQMHRRDKRRCGGKTCYHSRGRRGASRDGLHGQLGPGCLGSFAAASFHIDNINVSFTVGPACSRLPWRARIIRIFHAYHTVRGELRVTHAELKDRVNAASFQEFCSPHSLVYLRRYFSF